MIQIELSFSFESLSSDKLQHSAAIFNVCQKGLNDRKEPFWTTGLVKNKSC